MKKAEIGLIGVEVMGRTKTRSFAVAGGAGSVFNRISEHPQRVARRHSVKTETVTRQ